MNTTKIEKCDIKQMEFSYKKIVGNWKRKGTKEKAQDAPYLYKYTNNPKRFLNFILCGELSWTGSAEPAQFPASKAIYI